MGRWTRGRDWERQNTQTQKIQKDEHSDEVEMMKNELENIKLRIEERQ